MEQKLELTDVDVETFDRVINAAIRGKLALPGYENDALKGFLLCTTIAQLADRLGLLNVIVHVEEPLKGYVEELCRRERNFVNPGIKPEHIEFYFRVFPKGHSVRKILAQAVMTDGLSSFYPQRFSKTFMEVDGLAAEVLKELKENMVKITFDHPIIGKTITFSPSP